METQSLNALAMPVENNRNHSYDYDINFAVESKEAARNFFAADSLLSLDELLRKLSPQAGKNSFLVFKHHKYFTVPTDNIAFFYVDFGATIIKSFDGNDYVVKYSLKEVQDMVNGKQFFRVNRQYLVNFSAIKETEHYFARKMLVNLKVATAQKLLVNKENVNIFLHWLENR